MISAEEYFKKEYGEGHIKRAIELNDLQSIYTLMEEFADNTMQVKNNDSLHSVSNRLIVDDNHNYEYDGVAPITIKAVRCKNGFSVKQLGTGSITVENLNDC